MKKIILLLSLFLALSSCSETVQYPYINVGCKTEEYGRDYNEKCIYMSIRDYNTDTLKMFCQKLKEGHSESRLFYRYIFVLDSIHPYSSFYDISVDQIPVLYPHIKADYTHNTGNGYSELFIWDTNEWSGKAVKVNI